MNLLNHVEEVASGRSLDRMPLLALGFRPLYLLASVFAALSIALWALQFSGVLPQPYLNGPLWHAHEMVFGFALAVIVGFLLTAGRNWSGMPTLSGARLAALCALWVAGRVLVLTPWGWAAALTNAAFPLAAAVALAVPFVRSNNRRNYFFPALLVLLSLASVAVHMQQLGGLAPAPGFAVSIALDIVLLIMAVMAGRVIPMFTNNGVPGARASKHLLLERVSLGLLIALLAADALQVPAPAVLAVALAAFLVHAVRWWLWQPWTTLRTPLVWVLHLAYAWVVVHLALRAAAAAGVVPSSMAVHALTVGAMGGLIIGMMTRTARGHTGRPLRADGLDVTCYLLVAAAALVRVAVPLAVPAWTLGAVQLSAALWSAGFALYAAGYWRVLTRPRLDGQPG